MSYDHAVSKSLTIAYVGKGVDDGSIDIKDLAPSLLALGEMIEAANNALHPDGPKVSIRIRATSQGSFEVAIDVVMSLFKQLTTMLNSDVSNAAANLLTLLGFYAGAQIGAIQLIKALRGRKPEHVVMNQDGTVTLVIESEEITVRRETITLVELPEIRSSVIKFARPLQSDDVTAIEVRNLEAGASAVLATSADLEAIEAEFISEAEETIVSSSYETALKIVAPSFKEGTKWKFSDGDNTFFANINDSDFLAEVDANRSTFSKDDILIAEISLRQVRSGSHGIKSEYSVVRVIQHISAWQQLNLLGAATGSSPEDPQ